MITKTTKSAFHLNDNQTFESLTIGCENTCSSNDKEQKQALTIRIGDNEERKVTLTPSESDELAQFLLKINWK